MAEAAGAMAEAVLGAVEAALPAAVVVEFPMVAEGVATNTSLA